MRSLLVGLPLLVAASVLQSTVLPHLRLAGGTADLIWLLALSWTLSGDSAGGLLWGFVGGLCLDLLSGGPLGMTPAILVLLVYLASLLEGRLWGSHVVMPLAASALGTVGFHLLTLAMLAVQGWPVDWIGSLGSVILPAVLINTVCIVPFYQVLRRVHRLLRPMAVAF
jgi:rod shape-determining protein MreD